MPIPDKISIYGHYVTDQPYDGFVPRLCDALEQHQIPVIRLYEDFKASPEVLYFPTDTHWNPKGISMAIQKIDAILKE